MFTIIELQTTNGTTSHVVYTESGKNEALSKYHEIMHYAAISSVNIHACTVLDEQGKHVVNGVFIHPTVEAGE